MFAWTILNNPQKQWTSNISSTAKSKSYRPRWSLYVVRFWWASESRHSYAREPHGKTTLLSAHRSHIVIFSASGLKLNNFPAGTSLAPGRARLQNSWRLNHFHLPSWRAYATGLHKIIIYQLAFDASVFHSKHQRKNWARNRTNLLIGKLFRGVHDGPGGQQVGGVSRQQLRLGFRRCEVGRRRRQRSRLASSATKNTKP